MQPAADLKRQLGVWRKLVQQSKKKAGQEKPSSLHLPNVADYPHFVSGIIRLSWQPDVSSSSLKNQLCHALSFEWSTFRTSWVGWQLLAQAVHDDVLQTMGNARSCWTCAGIGTVGWVNEQWQGTSSSGVCSRPANFGFRKKCWYRRVNKRFRYESPRKPTLSAVMLLDKT